jgi:hypothetical protein
MPVQIKRLSEGFDDPSREGAGVLWGLEGRLDHGELVPAKPSNNIGVPTAGLETFRYLLEEGVSGRMTKGVIDALEAIQVQAQHSDAFIVPTDTRE